MKRELHTPYRFANVDDGPMAIAARIECTNPVRLRAAIGHLPPVEHEPRWVREAALGEYMHSAKHVGEAHPKLQIDREWNAGPVPWTVAMTSVRAATISPPQWYVPYHLATMSEAPRRDLTALLQVERATLDRRRRLLGAQRAAGTGAKPH